MSDVHAATVDDVEAATEVLARAFHDDPGTLVIEPDPERRSANLPAFFRCFLEASLAEEGGLFVAGTPVAGIACWFGPEQHGPSVDGLLAHGFPSVLERFGPEASDRLLAMVGELDRQHAERMTEPHLRLDFFGVDPERQGEGIGTTLLEAGHARADELGLSCYLETFTERNVRFYSDRGYEVVGTYPVGAGVPVWALVRPRATEGRV